MSLLKSERGKERLIDRSQVLLEERKLDRSRARSNQNRLSDMEEKMKQFGGLSDLEEDFLRDLHQNSQRLDNILNSVRNLVKMDPKTKRASVSPLGKPAVKRGAEKDKTSRRLIDRVEKAICDHPPLFSK